MLDKKGEWPVRKYSYISDLSGNYGPDRPVVGLTAEGEIAQIDVPEIISEVFHLMTEEQIDFYFSNYIINAPEQKMFDALGNDTGAKILKIREKVKTNPTNSNLTQEESDLLVFGFKNYLLTQGIRLPEEDDI